MSGPITRDRLSRLTPQEAAALWKVQQDTGTPVEAGLFEEWLWEDPANLDAWTEVEDSWSLCDEVDDPAFAELRRAALDAASPSDAAFGWSWRPAAAAAGIVALISGGLALHHGLAGLAPTQVAGSYTRQFSAQAGQAERVSLPDGSVMTLEGGAVAQAAFGTSERRVHLLQGTALFAVAKDPDRPFVAEALARTVTAVGTRFDVELAANVVRVNLYQGHVRVRGAGHPDILMEPGERLVMEGGRADALSGQRDGPNTATVDDSILMDNVTLADAVAQMNRAGNSEIVIADPDLAGLRLSGRFHGREPARFARTVSQLLPVRVSHDAAGRIILRRR